MTLIAWQLLWWGRRLAGVRVDLHNATLDMIAGLLEDAWRRRAPAGLREGKS